jgi:glycine/D-amino acid oxidase-like deaminating enzyme
VVGALSGYGIMAAHAAGELLAAHVTGEPLPAYAAAFLPSRYDDAAYRAAISEGGALVGQL